MNNPQSKVTATCVYNSKEHGQLPTQTEKEPSPGRKGKTTRKEREYTAGEVRFWLKKALVPGKTREEGAGKKTSGELVRCGKSRRHSRKGSRKETWESGLMLKDMAGGKRCEKYVFHRKKNLE